MTRRYLIVLFLCGGIFLADSCIDPYNPSTTKMDVHYLVVDGFLNSTEGLCIVKLSRTVPLDSSGIPPEENALVQLEVDDGVILTLSEGKAGEYSISNLSLDFNKKYRIKVVTTDNTEYVSEFVSSLTTPTIDSITWDTERAGVPIYANTHDPNNGTRYYYWKYTETWEYAAAFKSRLKIDSGKVKPRDNSLADAIYECWRTANSHDILVSSSNQLEEDVISEFTLATIPWNSPKLQRDYSILVEQRAISKEAYEYWQQLKKNTEDLGTLFDPLPSSVMGNFTCVTRPNEVVLGYFNSSTVEKMRIFINEKEIDWPTGTEAVTGYENCPFYMVPLGQTFNGLIPIEAAYDVGNDNMFIGHYASTVYCVDCRVGGGTNVKPDFWE
jgi:Domain of unknown function (DUF4249)